MSGILPTMEPKDVLRLKEGASVLYYTWQGTWVEMCFLYVVDSEWDQKTRSHRPVGRRVALCSPSSYPEAASDGNSHMRTYADCWELAKIAKKKTTQKGKTK